MPGLKNRLGPSKKEGFESVWRRVLSDLQSPPVTWDLMILKANEQNIHVFCGGMRGDSNLKKLKPHKLHEYLMKGLELVSKTYVYMYGEKVVALNFLLAPSAKNEMGEENICNTNVTPKTNTTGWRTENKIRLDELDFCSNSPLEPRNGTHDRVLFFSVWVGKGDKKKRKKKINRINFAQTLNGTRIFTYLHLAYKISQNVGNILPYIGCLGSRMPVSTPVRSQFKGENPMGSKAPRSHNSKPKMPGNFFQHFEILFLQKNQRKNTRYKKDEKDVWFSPPFQNKKNGISVV